MIHPGIPKIDLLQRTALGIPEYKARPLRNSLIFETTLSIAATMWGPVVDPRTGHTLLTDWRASGWAEVWILNHDASEKVRDYAKHLKRYRTAVYQLFDRGLGVWAWKQDPARYWGREAAYARWIEEHYPDKARAKGMCWDATAAMEDAFPELRRALGHYICPEWGPYTHWWCVTPEGTPVDPTALQFPSRGEGEYREYRPGEDPRQKPKIRKE